jgi:hypothetical protein
MWTHQYDQMSNQIACIKFPGKPIFRTNGQESHLFGLEPNYGCCTANFNQGWPKLALSAFMHREKEIVSAVLLPCELKESGLHIRLETDYPFENSARYTVESETDRTLVIRIPSFAQNVRINGELFAGAEYRLEVKAGEPAVLSLAFETVPYFEQRPHGLNAVRCGSLVFSVPIAYETRMLEFERNGVERKYPYCDYELIPQSAWNYGYCGEELRVKRHAVGAVPFSGAQPPVTVETTVQKIDWGLEDGYETVCAKVPESLEPLGGPETITLQPYGCAKLRMTELPILNK